MTPPFEAHTISQSNGSQAATVVIEARRLIRDCNLGPEFLRLIIGARHQRLTADPRRKAKIVFNSRRGAGLPSESAAIKDNDRKPLRRRINGGGKTGRSRPDHGDIVETFRINGAYQTETARQFVLTRVTQQLSAWTQHDR